MELLPLEAGISYAVARAIGYAAVADDAADEREPGVSETIERLQRITRLRSTAAAYRTVADGLGGVRDGSVDPFEWFLGVLAADDQTLLTAVAMALSAMQVSRDTTAHSHGNIAGEAGFDSHP